MPTVAEILKEHVLLDVECFDRLYLNGYIPSRQTFWLLDARYWMLDDDHRSCRYPASRNQHPASPSHHPKPSLQNLTHLLSFQPIEDG